MRRLRAISLILAAMTAAGCSSDASSDHQVDAGSWASASAALTVSDTGSVLFIKASQDCYGSYAVSSEPISGSDFSLSGTYTQLIGAYPGHVDYPAVITGTLAHDQLSVAVAVAALQQTFGPYTLSRGAGGWSACLYP